MLERNFALQYEITEILRELKKDTYELDSQTWKITELIIKFLEIIYNVTLELSSSEASASVVWPIIHQLLNIHLNDQINLSINLNL
jgi:hypothetical protein